MTQTRRKLAGVGNNVREAIWTCFSFSLLYISVGYVHHSFAFLVPEKVDDRRTKLDTAKSPEHVEGGPCMRNGDRTFSDSV